MTMAFPSIKQLESSSSTWDRGGLNSHFYRQVSLYSRVLLFLSFFIQSLTKTLVFDHSQNISGDNLPSLQQALQAAKKRRRVSHRSWWKWVREQKGWHSFFHSTCCRMLAMWEDPWRHRCADRKYCMPQGLLELYIAVYTDSISKCLYRGILLHILQFRAYWTHLNQPIPMWKIQF